MRTAVLFALVVFFPAFAHASVIFTEIMYDYPGTEGSGDHDWVEIYNNGQSTVDLSGSTVRFMEKGNNHLIASFAGSNTALAPGAIAIIANNPTQVKLDFPNIELLFDSSFSLTGTTTPLGIIIDGINVDPISYTPAASASNLGNSLQLVNGSWTATVPTPGTYAGTSDSTPPDTPSDSTDATTTTASSSGGGTPEYLPIPMLRIITSGARTVSSGADIAFTATVYDGKGNKRDDAMVTWTFGDGMRRTGASVYHRYYEPGEYLAVVHATTADGGDTLVETVITVKHAGIAISSVSPRGITLANNDSRTLDISLWRLAAGGKEFKLPVDTQILAGRTVLFPSQIIELPVADSASLLYPSGEVAAVYPAAATVQPPPLTARYESVQVVEPPVVSRVEPIISTRTNVPAYAEEVDAPAAATELAAAGAAVPPPASAPPSRLSGIFKSPWTLGLLGIIALAGSAFIFL